MSKTTISISAIWLRRHGNRVEVLAEIDGQFRLVIDENYDSQFGHIVEAIGMVKSPADYINAKGAP